MPHTHRSTNSALYFSFMRLQAVCTYSQVRGAVLTPRGSPPAWLITLLVQVVLAAVARLCLLLPVPPQYPVVCFAWNSLVLNTSVVLIKLYPFNYLCLLMSSSRIFSSLRNCLSYTLLEEHGDALQADYRYSRVTRRWLL